MNQHNKYSNLTPKTVSRSLIEILIDNVMQTGVESNTLQTRIESAGIEPDWPERVSIPDYLTLWKIAMELTGDKALGLRIGHHSHPDLSILGSLVLYCATLREVLQQICRFQNFMSDAISMALTEHNDFATLQCQIPESKYYAPQLVDQGCAFLISWARQFCNTSINPLEVRFPHAVTHYEKEYLDIFQAPVLFDQADCAIVFSHAQLALAIPHHDPLLKDFIHPGLVLQDQDYKTTSGFAEEVTHLISAHLPMGRIGVDLIAKKLNISRQTMHRKLKAEDTTFLALLEHRRKQLAAHYLRQDKTPISEIALLLGFAEPKSFRRAFKRWYGISPKAFRDNA